MYKALQHYRYTTSVTQYPSCHKHTDKLDSTTSYNKNNKPTRKKKQIQLADGSTINTIKVVVYCHSILDAEHATREVHERGRGAGFRNG